MLSGSSGYTKNPDGIIIQWGSIPDIITYQGSATVRFPTYFSWPFVVVACPSGDPVYIDDNGTLHVTDIGSYSFTVRYSGDNKPAPGGYWIAVGK